MLKYEIEFYEKENGEQPAKEFLLSLDVKMRAKMASTISILQDNGNELNAEDAAVRNRKSKKVPRGLSAEKGERQMSTKFDDFLKEQLQDPEFKKEYDALQPERAVIQAMIDARKRSGLTQKELSERSGIAQGDISKLENGNANPSIKTLQRLASGMGMTLKVEFVLGEASRH